MFDTPSTRRNFICGALAGGAALSLAAVHTPAKATPKHIVLLGDSILDNGAYVGNGPDVIEQLGNRLPLGSRATLQAIDGSLTSGVRLQLKIAPEDATHYVISAGGNDAPDGGGLRRSAAAATEGATAGANARAKRARVQRPPFTRKRPRARGRRGQEEARHHRARDWQVPAAR